MLNKLVLVSTVLFTLGLNANAQNAKVKFNKRSWDSTNKEVVNTTKSITDYTVIEGNHAGDWYQLGVDDGKDHYYVVNGEANYQTLNTFGRAHLILCDGATLTITGGVKVENNAHIFIYGQKDDSGKLTVTNSYEDAAGIGSAKGVNCGDITIHGGDISATAYDGAGIGGGYEGNGCTVVINDGNVRATGNRDGATGYASSAAIGGGASGKGGDVTINGGTVRAECVVYSTYSTFTAEYIGRGYHSSDNGKLTLGDGVRVYDNFHTPHEWAPADERVDYTAAERGYKDDYILIETCPHEDLEYVDDNHNRIVCSHCKMDGQVIKNFVDYDEYTGNKNVSVANAKKSAARPQGISKFDVETSNNEPIYDLSGHKYDASMLANGQLPKGIYIQGGKKFAVK